MTSHLILTRIERATEDANKWGVNSGCICVDDEGTLDTCAALLNCHPSKKAIVILVMDEVFCNFDEASATRVINLLKELLGDSPRIWNHFGSATSENITLDRIVDDWEDQKEYSILRQAFTDNHPKCGPMPYSQSGGALWDPVFNSADGLTKAIKIGLSTGNIGEIKPRINKLDECWEKAERLFPTSLADEFPNVALGGRGLFRLRKLAYDLMPVYIYLDGLLCARGRDNFNGMASIVQKNVPEVLKTIRVADKSPAAECINKQVKCLERIEANNADLVTKSTAFCKWYRRFLEKVSPE